MVDPIQTTCDLLARELVLRDTIFPARDAENDRRIQDLQRQFTHSINTLGAEADNSINDSFGISPAFADECVFLCGYMKCGTTLLLGLLDNHPELVALPGDSWFKGYRYLDCENASEVHGDDFRDKWLGRIVNPTGQAPFWLFGKDVKPYVDFVSHYKYWNEKTADPRMGHLVSVLLSYHTANPRRVPNPRFWIEKTPGNEFEIERILSFFPKARFLHIVRDPRENLASLKRLYLTRGWDWFPLSYAKKMGQSCKLASVNEQKLGKDRYFVLDYEKLTSDTRTSMRRIAEFIGVEWSESLLVPTVNGQPAQANSMYSDRKVTGSVRPATRDKWMKVLTPKEKRAILCTQKDAAIAGYLWELRFQDRLMNTVDKVLSVIRFRMGVKDYE